MPWNLPFPAKLGNGFAVLTGGVILSNGRGEMDCDPIFGDHRDSLLLPRFIQKPKQGIYSWQLGCASDHLGSSPRYSLMAPMLAYVFPDRRTVRAVCPASW